MRCFRRIQNSSFQLKVLCATVLIFYYFGLFTMIRETKYEELDGFMGNISAYIELLAANKTPPMPARNGYDYSFISNSKDRCNPDEVDYPLRVIFIIKSATINFNRRAAIRKTWGFEKRFSDVSIKTVFVLGLPSSEKIQSQINEESKRYKDIVQATFLDTYYNNTIKTMMGIKWAVTFCPHSKFYFFSDDDMYVSGKNVLKFLRNPLEYPNYLEVPFTNLHGSKSNNKWPLGQVLDIELPSDTELFAGYMFPNSRPHRHFSSKWYISLEEYPFSRYPPYITAGAYVLSRNALKKLYYASFYVNHFRFDDIYLALLAKACNIVPVHNDEFYFYKKPYDALDYKYVIASHGYEDPQELYNVWIEQKSLGNA